MGTMLTVVELPPTVWDQSLHMFLHVDVFIVDGSRTPSTNQVVLPVQQLGETDCIRLDRLDPLRWASKSRGSVIVLQVPEGGAG